MAKTDEVNAILNLLNEATEANRIKNQQIFDLKEENHKQRNSINAFVRQQGLEEEFTAYLVGNRLETSWADRINI